MALKLRPIFKRLPAAQFFVLFAGLLAVLNTMIGAIGAARAADAVDLALVLAIDCSYSVDSAEYDLQIDGMAYAFSHPHMIGAIASGPHQRIAVTLVQWANSSTQATVLPWRILRSPQSITNFARELSGISRVVPGGGTSITGMMRYAYGLLSRKPFKARRMVIDIVADGRNNSGGDPRQTRDILAALGITVNGLTILNEVPTLDAYFKRNIIGGPGNFVIKANEYPQFKQAIFRKRLREIEGPGVANLPRLYPENAG